MTTSVWTLGEGRLNGIEDLPFQMAPESHLKVKDKRLQCVLWPSLSEQFREDWAKPATQWTFKVEPNSLELGRASLPCAPKVRPLALAGRGPLGLRGREWSEERLEFPGAGACASLGSAGLLSARAFRPSRALSVGYLIWSTQEPG